MNLKKIAHKILSKIKTQSRKNDIIKEKFYYENVNIVVWYFVKNYPHKRELTIKRLCLMCYLADWKSCIDNKRQITHIIWNREKVLNCGNWFLLSNDFFKLNQDDSISINDTSIVWNVSFYETKKILNHIIRVTEDLYSHKLYRLVFSTYPMSTMTAGYFDLVSLAKSYAKSY